MRLPKLSWQIRTVHGDSFRRTALLGTGVTALGLAALSIDGVMVSPVNPELILLLFTLLVAANFGLRFGLVSAVVCNLSLFYLFLAPRWKLRVNDEQELVSMVVFLIASVIGSSLLELANAARRADALQEADEMKMAILASISHDLKTPLATIRTATSSLLESDVAWSESDRRAFLESIREETNQLDRTISDLLALNRVETGSVRPNIRPESIAQIAEDAVELKAGVIGARPLIFNVPDVSLPTDSSLVRQALANLIENAALHSRPAGSIRIDAQVHGPDMLVAVEDEGPGVDAEELAFIFNPYYRARGGRAAPNGSGLGLAIVKGFVALCGGSVRAESGPTATRFVISLPMEARNLSP